MTDIVISGRISFELMDQLKTFDKTKSEIIVEALNLYVASKTNKEPRIQGVYNPDCVYDINTIHKAVDGFKPVNSLNKEIKV